MVKGDTMAFNFQIQGLAGYTLTGITFTCKENPNDETAYFTRTLDAGNGISQVAYDSSADTTTFCCRVAPENTEELDPARYYYDLELAVGGDVFTLMKGRLTLERDVTN